MCRSTVSLALLCLAAPAMAQGKGSFALDAMTTPGRHFGVGYYLSDGLSLRPSLGASYSGAYGASFNLGTGLRWELLPGHRLSPYVTGGFNYSRNPSLVQYDSSGSLLTDASPNVARYGAGLGLRARLRSKLAFVAEGLVMNSALHDAAGFSRLQTLQPGTHFEAAVGLSYSLN